MKEQQSGLQERMDDFSFIIVSNEKGNSGNAQEAPKQSKPPANKK